jgi:hypothetical protein
MIPGIVRGVMMTARKVTPGALARQVGIRNLLGVNLISLWGIRNLLGTTQGLVMMTMEIIEVDLDVEIEAEGEEGILGMVVVDHHGMEAIEMMNQVVEGLESHGTEGILMVAEEEAEVALGEVTVIKTTLGQEMVAAGALAGEMVAAGALEGEMVAAGALEGEMVVVGALAGEMVAAVVTGTGTTTMKESPSVKVVAGLSLPTGMPTKLSRTASPAGKHKTPLLEMIRQERVIQTTPGVRTDLHLSWVSQAVRKASPAGKRKTPLVEMIRQERVMQTTPGVRTDRLHLSWVSQVVVLTSLAPGALPVEELAVEVLGERATRITGTHREDQPKISLHGVVGQKFLPRKRSIHGAKVARGAGAQEGVVAVPGIKRQMVHGTATRVLIPAVVDGKNFRQNKLAPYWR